MSMLQFLWGGYHVSSTYRIVDYGRDVSYEIRRKFEVHGTERVADKPMIEEKPFSSSWVHGV